jgi:hypothetical protein
MSQLTSADKGEIPLKVELALECPYCNKITKTYMDKRTAENKDYFAITWKCPGCSAHSKIYHYRLYPLEVDPRKLEADL